MEKRPSRESNIHSTRQRSSYGPRFSREFKSYIMFFQRKLVRVAAVWMLRSENSARDSWLRVLKLAQNKVKLYSEICARVTRKAA